MIGNRQAANRLLQPAGSNCQQNAPVSSVSGTQNSPASIVINDRSMIGAKMRPATKPSTTLGRLAIISIVGLMRAFHRGCMNWLAKIAARMAMGVAKSIE